MELGFFYGNTSTKQQPIHQYEESGLNVVVLKVEGIEGSDQYKKVWDVSIRYKICLVCFCLGSIYFEQDGFLNNDTLIKNYTVMQPYAFKMKLKPGNKAEYKKRHDKIWPELEKALVDAGISNYFIFLDEETDTLFALQKLDDDYDSQKLAELPIMKKWWNHMADLMLVNPDNSPVVVPLEEVFQMN